jgi:U3 small nucleolar ribonucleoprotein protein IMP3
MVRRLANRIALLAPEDPFRQEMADALINKLYGIGLITSKSNLSQTDKISVSAICRSVSLIF